MELLHMVIAGVIATATLDLWQQVFRLVVGLPITNWGMIGRWVGHFEDGQFVHKDIGAAPPVPGENVLGWIVHYVVGVGYAVVYFGLMWFVFRTPPSLASALIFAALSVSVTWFVMEPILGAGVMASHVPGRFRVLAQDFTSHLSLGFGLFVGDFVARALLGT